MKQITIVTFSFLPNSFLLLEFSFVFILLLFLSLVGSTPEPEVIGGRIRSVSHPGKKINKSNIWVLLCSSLAFVSK